MPWFSITRWSDRLTPRPVIAIVAPGATTVVPAPPGERGSEQAEVHSRVVWVAAPPVVDTQVSRVVTVNRPVPASMPLSTRTALVESSGREQLAAGRDGQGAGVGQPCDVRRLAVLDEDARPGRDAHLVVVAVPAGLVAQPGDAVPVPVVGVVPVAAVADLAGDVAGAAVPDEHVGGGGALDDDGGGRRAASTARPRREQAGEQAGGDRGLVVLRMRHLEGRHGRRPWWCAVSRRVPAGRDGRVARVNLPDRPVNGVLKRRPRAFFSQPDRPTHPGRRPWTTAHRAGHHGTAAAPAPRCAARPHHAAARHRPPRTSARPPASRSSPSSACWSPAPANAYTTTPAPGVPVPPARVRRAGRPLRHRLGRHRPDVQAVDLPERPGRLPRRRLRAAVRARGVPRRPLERLELGLRHNATGTASIGSGVTSAKAPNLSLLPTDGSGYYRVRVEMTWTSAIGAYLGSTNLTHGRRRRLPLLDHPHLLRRQRLRVPRRLRPGAPSSPVRPRPPAPVRPPRPDRPEGAPRVSHPPLPPLPPPYRPAGHDRPAGRHPPQRRRPGRCGRRGRRPVRRPRRPGHRSGQPDDRRARPRRPRRRGTRGRPRPGAGQGAARTPAPRPGGRRPSCGRAGLAGAARGSHVSEAEVTEALLSDPGLYVDDAGNLTSSEGAGGAGAVVTTGAPDTLIWPIGSTNALHSRPSSPRKIYLDFNGHTSRHGVEHRVRFLLHDARLGPRRRPHDLDTAEAAVCRRLRHRRRGLRGLRRGRHHPGPRRRGPPQDLDDGPPTTASASSSARTPGTT